MYPDRPRIDNIDGYEQSLILLQAFRFMNYGAASQDVLGSYGSQNVEYIRQVATKYDPDGVFQERIPGGFKISRVD